MSWSVALNRCIDKDKQKEMIESLKNKEIKFLEAQKKAKEIINYL